MNCGISYILIGTIIKNKIANLENSSWHQSSVDKLNRLDVSKERISELENLRKNNDCLEDGDRRLRVVWEELANKIDKWLTVFLARWAINK